MVAQALQIRRPASPPLEGRRPCGRGFTRASNKMPRQGDGDGSTEGSVCTPAHVKMDATCMSAETKTSLARRLRDVVRNTRSAEAVAYFMRDLDPECQAEIDTWEAICLEIDEADDVTEMVFEAVRASGFTGREPQFRELPQ
jgi:hypothetical protein